MNHLEHCAALEVEIAKFAEVLRATTPETPVPSCPAWTVRDLAQHLGTVHRWANHLVGERSPVRVSPAAVNVGSEAPNDAWIRDGGAQLLGTLRSCDPDIDMWAWGADQHAKFWSRRQLHETLVHRMDVELAQGVIPQVDEGVAADGVDEFLTNLPYAATFSPGVKTLTGSGNRLAFSQVDGDRRWTLRLEKTGVSFAPNEGDVEVELEATALTLLLLIYRRRRLDDADVTVMGNRELLRFWLANSALG